VRAAGVLAAIALALAVQTTLVPLVFGSIVAVDLVLVVVVYAALSSGPAVGLLTGSVAGLAQDVLSGGIIGVGGLAKTLVGFLTGVGGSQFIVARPLPRMAVFVLATFVHAACFLGLYAMITPGAFASPYRLVAWQAIGNAVIGLLAFHTVEGLPSAWQRRRSGVFVRGRR